LTRIISALVLLPVVVGVIWFLPPAGTLALAAVASALAVYEYAGLASAMGVRIPRMLTGAGVLATCIVAAIPYGPVDVVLMCSLLVIGAFTVSTGTPGPGLLRGIAVSMLPLIYIGLPLGALAAIRLIGGREALMLLLATIVISDTGQYYTGRALGRRPLAPSISPKKTIEGAIGGVIFGMATMAIGGRLVFPAENVPVLLFVGAAVVGFGIAGDLFESLLKRSAGVKDSSGLIPGHGGILDRIDSWLFAAPVFYVFIRFVQA
jgi:phosphatidate cytidylyltransferase